MLIEASHIPVALRVAAHRASYNTILVCDPSHYRVEYALNPHMQDESGNLQQVNHAKAISEWQKLVETFRSLRFKIWKIAAQKELPDMVFTANQSLQIGEREVVLSRMASMQREDEVQHFKKFYIDKGWKVHELAFDKFEGMGDGIWHPGVNLLWGGYGLRSSLKSYQLLSQQFDFPIITLKLIDPHFYHLDTCFFVINSECAAYVPKAFDEGSIEKLRNGFNDLIEIDYQEAKNNFAGNAFCPDGIHVVLQQGSKKLCHELVARKLTPIEVETGEFIKGGGSCFCLKMALY